MMVFPAAAVLNLGSQDWSFDQNSAIVLVAIIALFLAALVFASLYKRVNPSRQSIWPDFGVKSKSVDLDE